MQTFLTSEIPAFSGNDWLVCLLGIGTVFVGLIGVIIACAVLGAICKGLGKKTKTEDVKKAKIAPSPEVVSDEQIPDKEQFVAAVSAALAEYMGEDVNSFRIVSIKKI
ncbi:MAG: OadG family protein [Clostridia bacterium]|nr:OadG family protein [Clostridia bacterium]